MVFLFTQRTYVADIFVLRHIQLIFSSLFEVQRERRHANRGSNPCSMYLYFVLKYLFPDFSLFYILNLRKPEHNTFKINYFPRANEILDSLLVQSCRIRPDPSTLVRFRSAWTFKFKAFLSARIDHSFSAALIYLLHWLLCWNKKVKGKFIRL